MAQCTLGGQRLARMHVSKSPVSSVAFTGYSRETRKCTPCLATAEDAQGCMSRRDLFAAGVATSFLLVPSDAAHAGFNKDLKKKKLTAEDYTFSEEVGLPVFEVEEGRGTPARIGDRVVVHFDSIYRGIDIQSSRSARLLGGNRTIAEPYPFVVGDTVEQTKAKLVGPEGGGGLYAGQSGPKPPRVLSTAVIGMKKGGKRIVLVNNPELGYGSEGMQEMPPNSTFELKVELLDVFPQ